MYMAYCDKLLNRVYYSALLLCTSRFHLGSSKSKVKLLSMLEEGALVWILSRCYSVARFFPGKSPFFLQISPKYSHAFFSLGFLELLLIDTYKVLIEHVEFLLNISDYFRFHVCLSLSTFVCMFVRASHISILP